MPGRLRTGSSPSSTWIADASYEPDGATSPPAGGRGATFDDGEAPFLAVDFLVDPAAAFPAGRFATFFPAVVDGRLAGGRDGAFLAAFFGDGFFAAMALPLYQSGCVAFGRLAQRGRLTRSSMLFTAPSVCSRNVVTSWS